ncbi:hypothetical protein C7S18_18165 [Ahniella affigens]|uniref:Polymer-forming cytoskeletal protein n=1 Tax=Ahniella affigens TaxID=2021234 RepID=A0A2P1PVX3_9GAMM|nr:polymer-forming cytoskeletal protein [Ahniella affigens]AVP98980.1 hypothetical protein C7S18_18165 [Ahniella affigens]
MRLLPAVLTVLTALPGFADAATARVHFAKEIELAAGEVAGDLSMIAGKISLNADSRADQILVDNGRLVMKAGSHAAGVRVNSAEAVLAGTITGDVFCGVGSLQIEAPARVDGNVVNLGCDLQIGKDVTIGGDIISFSDQNRIGPNLKLPGRVLMLPGADRRSKNRDLPKLNLLHDVHIAGGLHLGHCVQLERGNRVQAEYFGIAPHEPLNMDRDRPKACKPLPGAAGLITKPQLDGIEPVYVFTGAALSRDQTLGDATLVFMGQEVPPGAKVGHLRTINGAVVLSERAEAAALNVVNGAVVLKDSAHVRGAVEVRNGPLLLEANAVISGPVTVYNSYIQVQKGARIDGPVTFYGETLAVALGGQVGDVRIARLDDQPSEGKRGRPTVHLQEGAAVRGKLVFDRPAKLKISHGPAPQFTGISPELKIVKPDRR